MSPFAHRRPAPIEEPGEDTADTPPDLPGDDEAPCEIEPERDDPPQHDPLQPEEPVRNSACCKPEMPRPVATSRSLPAGVMTCGKASSQSGQRRRGTGLRNTVVVMPHVPQGRYALQSFRFAPSIRSGRQRRCHPAIHARHWMTTWMLRNPLRPSCADRPFRGAGP